MTGQRCNAWSRTRLDGSARYNRGVSDDSTAQQQRLLGLDFGTKTIGLALSDPLGITAQGLPTLRRKNKRTDLTALEKVIREYAVAEIVIGLPLRMSGAEGIMAEKVHEFVAVLQKRFEL